MAKALLIRPRKKALKLRAKYAAARKKWEESKHPRAAGGKFGETPDAAKGPPRREAADNVTDLIPRGRGQAQGLADRAAAKAREEGTPPKPKQSLDELIKGIKAKNAAYTEAVKEALDTDGIFVAAKGNRAIAVTRSNRDPDKLQVTRFDEQGPVGHVETDPEKVGAEIPAEYKQVTGEAADRILSGQADAIEEAAKLEKAKPPKKPEPKEEKPEAEPEAKEAKEPEPKVAKTEPKPEAKEEKPEPEKPPAPKPEKPAAEPAAPKPKKQYKSARELHEDTYDPSVTAEDIKNRIPGARPYLDQAAAINAAGVPTDGVHAHMDAAGKKRYSATRLAKHREILNEMFSDAAIARATPPPGEAPVFTALGGRGGSGKSWLTEDPTSPVNTAAIVIDNDAFKAKLPEYTGDNTALVHEEASDLTYHALTYARAMGLNVVYDATMRSPGGIGKYVGEFKAAGYRAEGYYMHAAPQVAAERAVGRYIKGEQSGQGGRYVPPEYVLSSTTNEQVFDDLTPQLDNWGVYSSNDGFPPVPVISKAEAAPPTKAAGPRVAPSAMRKTYAEEIAFKDQLGPVESREANYEQLLAGDAPHAGRSYSDRAVLDENGIIHSDDVADVSRALYEGKKVNLVDKGKTAIAIKHLGKVSSRMAKMGAKAKTFDLCNMTVSGTNLFCVQSKGIPRVQMPQLSGKPLPGSPASQMAVSKTGWVDLTDQFRTHIAELGYRIEDVDVPAVELKATQNELNGVKVAGIANSMRADTAANKSGSDVRVFVSHDNYIVDGHHRWAAKVGIDYEDGKTGDVLQQVAKVDASITELLALSNKFALDMGIPQAAV